MRETAGLSILLEGYHNATHNKSPQVINKTLSIKPPSPPLFPSSSFSSPLPAITFLDSCFLCKQRLLPGNDIYMYKGDRAFCSVECRCRQIFMDEECVGVGREMNCSFAARKPINGTSSASSSSSAAAASSRRRSKGNKSRSDWFAY